MSVWRVGACVCVCVCVAIAMITNQVMIRFAPKKCRPGLVILPDWASAGLKAVRSKRPDLK